MMGRPRRSLFMLVLAVVVFARLGFPPQRLGAAETRCFPETGYCLSGRFLAYWEENGGLAVFGFPLTPARAEVNRDTGQSYLTQWLERNRFELHPENAWPYDVLLGRLGDDRLLQQDRPWQSLPAGDPGASHFFPATGHAIADVFWPRWSGVGLELGDPGTTERESLALFGMPISEPAMETNASGDTVLTQWFERARFEHHPGNQPPYHILLGLLGSEVRGGVVVDEPRASPGAYITVQVGPAEVVLGPDGVTDNPFNTLAGERELLAFVGNATTNGWVGGSLETLRPLSAPVIGPGPGFDSCGGWLNSAWRDGPVVRGWYHAEQACKYPVTHKSVAYAESTDGGRSFTKVDYPANQVITTPPQYTSEREDDEGDHHVLQVGDYLYMYFVASRDYQVRLARSHIRDGGRPDTWFKYHNGSFSSPGMGGESSPVDPSGALSRSWVSFNTYTQSYMGLSYIARGYTGKQDRFAGFGLTFSTNGIDGWQSLPYVVLPSEGSWDDAVPRARDLADYPSLISLYGDSSSAGDVFWLYSMGLEADGSFEQRYLLRRKVRLGSTTSTSTLDRVPKIALGHYQKGRDSWFTTTPTDPSYHQLGILGYVLSDEIPGARPLYDCYLPNERDHMVDINAGCSGGHYVRRLGWVQTAPFPGGMAVYRCFDATSLNHFLSGDQSCEGKTTEWLVGYLATQPVFPAPAMIALSGYYDAARQDTREATTLPPDSYDFRGRLGYLFTSTRPDTIPVYDCYLPRESDHMIDTDPGCGNPSVPNMGLLGWIATRPVQDSIAVYRCYDPATYDHFVSADPHCGGQTVEWRIGYLVSRASP